MRKFFTALLAARAVTALAALYAGVNPLHAGAWIRWDSNHYLSIAQRGYFLEQCGAEWCGNAGWFPLYAWLLKLIPGALLSLVCEALLLWLLRNEELPVLLLVALFPGCIYQQAVFPVSLFLVCAVLVLRGYWGFGTAAAMAYPTGVLLIPARRDWKTLVAIAIGVVLVLVVFKLQTGRFDAYFLTQHKYGFHFAPLDTLGSRLKPLFNARYRNFATFASAAQTLLVLITVALALSRWRVNQDVAAYTFVYWAFPLCVGGRLSLYRAESLLAPAALLLPPRARLPVLIAAVPIAFAISVAFFRGALV